MISLDWHHVMLNKQAKPSRPPHRRDVEVTVRTSGCCAQTCACQADLVGQQQQHQCMLWLNSCCLRAQVRRIQAWTFVLGFCLGLVMLAAAANSNLSWSSW